MHAGFTTGRARVVNLIARRGPARVKLTPQELKEIGAISGIRVVFDPADLEPGPGDDARLDADRRARRMVDQFRKWVAEMPDQDPDAAEQAALAAGDNVVRFRFHRAPVEVVEQSGTVSEIVVERTEPLVDGHLRNTGETATIEAQSVYSAVGYRSSALPGVPFDEAAATIPHSAAVSWPRPTPIQCPTSAPPAGSSAGPRV